ncbi:MFS transporter [Salinirubellus salinus]|uniref:MFS transporter n=1 Tax=Salinirubellus salinus TaxID=1364945 RepID=A0A9E7R073_9EURY|nr:MFS transporter [Salinirubellus salinus]UWM53270.1 MFS transporter [Salinirubellus salinus]
MSSGVDGAGVTDRRQRRVLLVGASLLSVSMSAFELVPASVTPLIRDSMGVSAAEAGLVVGTMFGTAVVASLPVGAVLDRTDSRLAVAAAIGLLLVSGAWGYLAGTAGDYPALLASRVVGGLAYVVVWNAGIDIVGRAFPPATRATAVSTFTASGPVGFALGQALGPVVAGVFGWPAVFPVFAVSTLLGLTLFWPASRGTGRVEDQPAPTPADLRRVVTDRRVVLVGVLGFLAYSLYLFVNSWAPSYLTEELKLSLALGGALTALFPAVGVLSRVSGGLLSDRLFDGRRTPVVFGSFLVATPVVAGFTSLRGVPVIVAALLVAGFAIQLSLGLVFAYVRELVDPAVAATAVAFLTSVGLAGAFLAPIAAGAIIERSGYETAFLVAGGLGLVGVVLARVASEPT